MNQCQCTLIIGQHFSESGVVRLIREYTLEYSADDIKNFLRSSHGTIFFDDWMNTISISYCETSLLISPRYGLDRMIACDPNEVPSKLEKLSPQAIQDQMYEDLTRDDMCSILVGLINIANELRSNLVGKCHKNTSLDNLSA